MSQLVVLLILLNTDVDVFSVCDCFQASRVFQHPLLVSTLCGLLSHFNSLGIYFFGDFFFGDLFV